MFLNLSSFLSVKMGNMETIIAGTLIGLIAILTIWTVNYLSHECNNNSDCGDDSYCGAENSCHKYPTTPVTIVKYNFLGGALIIAFAIIVAAIILRTKKFRLWKD